MTPTTKYTPYTKYIHWRYLTVHMYINHLHQWLYSNFINLTPTIYDALIVHLPLWCLLSLPKTSSKSNQYSSLIQSATSVFTSTLYYRSLILNLQWLPNTILINVVFVYDTSWLNSYMDFLYSTLLFTNFSLSEKLELSYSLRSPISEFIYEQHLNTYL